MTSTVKASEARSRLFHLMEQAGRGGHRFVLTRDGKPQAVLMGAEEYEEWVETLEILGDRKLLRGIDRGLADLKAGRKKSFEEVFGRRRHAAR